MARPGQNPFDQQKRWQPSLHDSFRRVIMANIIVVGGKVDDKFHAEINKHAAGGYKPILMNTVATDNARTKESEVYVTVLMEKP
jgi:hypothetical protein